MQLLYGNDGVNYRVIDKSAEMTDGVQKTLLGSYSRYDFVTDPKVYSSVAQEPEAITYVSTNLDNQLKSDQVVVCKMGHMRNFSSPSYYFHGLVKEVPADYYKKDFFELFGYQFIPDVEANSAHYSGGTVDGYQFPVQPVNQKALTDEQLIVILASFLSNDKKGQKTKILCDASGDDYNRRSREILASIYHYLPYELRKRYGFKSYSQDEKNLPARVAFVVFPKEEVHDVTGFVTLQESRGDIAHSVEREYLDYAAYLVEKLDDSQRTEHFETMSKLASNGYLRIKDCVDYYNNLKNWSNGTQEALLPDWIQYIDQNSFRKGPLYEMLLKIIVAKVDNAYYNDYLFDQTLRLYQENVYNLSPQAAKTMRFADCLDEIFIEPARFHEWYQEQLQAKINMLRPEQKESPVYMAGFYEEEIRALEQVDIMSEELKELLQTEVQNLRAKIRSNAANVEEQKDREVEELHRQVSKIGRVEDLVSMVEILRRNIQFAENKEVLTANVEEWLAEHIPDRITSESELRIWKEQVEKLGGNISAEMQENILRELAREEQLQIQARESRKCVIRPGEVLRSYRNLVEYLAKGVLQPEDKVIAEIGKRAPSEYKASTMLKMLSFILYPEDESQGSVSIAWKRVFLEEKLMTAEHAEYLLKDPEAEEEFVKRVVHFFLKEDSVRISGIYLARLIQRYHPELNAMFRKLYEKGEDEEYFFSDELKTLSASAPKRSNWAYETESEPQEDHSKQGKKGSLGGLFGRKW